MVDISNLFKKKPKAENPLSKLAEPEKRADETYKWFAVEPAVIYPRTIARIQECLKTGELPQELVQPAVDVGPDPRSVAFDYLSRARAIPYEAWAFATVSKERTPLDKQKMRAEALNIARLWYTQALHVANDMQPIGLHIKSDPDYKM